MQNGIAAKQNMAQAITLTAIEVTKIVIMAVKEAENPVNIAKSVQARSRTGGQH